MNTWAQLGLMVVIGIVGMAVGCAIGAVCGFDAGALKGFDAGCAWAAARWIEVIRSLQAEEPSTDTPEEPRQ